MSGVRGERLPAGRGAAMSAYNCPTCHGECPCHSWTHAGGPCDACLPYLFDELDEAVRELTDATSSEAHPLSGHGARHRVIRAWGGYATIREKIRARFRPSPPAAAQEPRP